MRMQTAVAGIIAMAFAAGVPGGHSAAIAGQGDTKAAAALAATRKAIGGKKLEALKTLSVQAAMQRNVGTVQMTSDLELLVELPDKYLRSETPSSGMGMPAGFSTGFNGDRSLRSGGAPAMGPGGSMVIRMGAGPGGPPAEQPTPEQQAEIDKAMVRSSRAELSRMMLGWFAAAHPSINATYTYAGEAESPDGKAHVIDVKNSDGFSARIFIDQASNLPLMVTFQGAQPRVMTMGGTRGAAPAGQPVHEARPLTEDERQKARDDAGKQLQGVPAQPPTMVEHTLFFDEWREADGVRFPHRMRRAIAGATTEEWTFSKVRVNPKIDPKKFQSES